MIDGKIRKSMTEGKTGGAGRGERHKMLLSGESWGEKELSGKMKGEQHLK